MKLLDSMIVIGAVVTVHGIRGKIKILPQTYDNARFKRLKSIYLVDKAGDLLAATVQSVQYQVKHVLISVEEITTRDEALKFVGGSIAVDDSEIISLPADTYFHFQLVGMQVESIDGIVYGVIRRIIETGSNDVYEVVSDAGKVLMVPAISAVVKSVEPASNKMIIELVEGLIDD